MSAKNQLDLSERFCLLAERMGKDSEKNEE